MKKIIFACVASALLLAGCSDNNDKEKDSSSETSITTVTTAATESYSETMESTIAAETVSAIPTTTVTFTDSEKETTATESNQKQSTSNHFSNDTVQEELPIMSEKEQDSKVKTTDSPIKKPKETVTTTVVKSTEPVSTSVNDDVIELPFVSVR